MKKTNLTHCVICKSEIKDKKSVVTNHSAAVKDWLAYCADHAPSWIKFVWVSPRYK